MIILVIVLVVAFVVCVFLAPNLLTICIQGLDDYRNYVNIVSSILSGLVGSVGVILGYFYYKDKQKNDEKRERREKKAMRIDRFLKVVDDCDSIIERLFHKQVGNDGELKLLLDQLQKNSELLMIFMENNEKLIGFSDEEMSPVREWYSIIGSSPIVKVLRKRQITERLIQVEQEKYRSAIRSAKNVLICKSADHA